MRKVKDIKPGQLFFMDQLLSSYNDSYVMLVSPSEYHN